MHKVFLLLLLSIAPLSYEPLSDVSWELCDNSEYTARYDAKPLKLVYNFCSTSERITNIDKALVRGTEMLFDFAKIKKLSSVECISDRKLDIYNVSFDILNDGRFPEWSNQSPFGIWALYDPRVNSDKSSIMITDQGDSRNDIILSHELAHYWYDRLCWNKEMPDAEAFAMEFEKFYIERRGR